MTAFRPRAIGKAALTRLLLLATGSAGAALLLWGYIAPRYLGDFVPFLILASAVAMADIFRRLGARQRSVRVGAVAVISVAALFSVAANVGVAIVPNEEWSTTQVLNYVQAQKSVSDLTGHPLAADVVRGNSLPLWGPAGQLYIIGDCSGLYESNGEIYSTVPSEQYQRTTWMTVELGQGFKHTFRVGVQRPPSQGTVTVPLVSAGKYTVTMTAEPTGSAHRVLLVFAVHTGAKTVRGASFGVNSGTTHTVVVTTDPLKHQIAAGIDGVTQVGWNMTTHDEPIHVVSTGSGSQSGGRVLLVQGAPGASPTLCKSLAR